MQDKAILESIPRRALTFGNMIATLQTPSYFREALDDLKAKVKLESKLIALFGSSGCGKTHLLRFLAD